MAWKCLVCGYSGVGDDIPDVCPVCGAPRDQLVDTQAPASPPQPSRYGGIALTDILAAHATPVVVFDADRLRANARSLLDNIGARGRGMFSVKSCYLLEVIKVLFEAGLDAEVCSFEEALLARRAGLPESRIFWNAVSFRDGDIDAAVAEPYGWIGVCALDDLERLIAAADAQNTTVNVALRVQINRGQSPYLQPGSRLGFSVDGQDVWTAVQRISDSPNVRLRAIHSHSQIQQTDGSGYQDAADVLSALVTSISEKGFSPPPIISLGGGLAVASSLVQSDHGPSFLGRVIDATLSNTPGLESIVVEPGRFLVEDAAIGLTKIISRRTVDGVSWWVVDMGSNYLVPFEGRTFKFSPLEPSSGAPLKVSIGDISSTYSGVFCRDQLIASVPHDETLVVSDIGSYTASVAQHFMLTLPTVLMADGGKLIEVSHKETPEDWLSHWCVSGRDARQ